MRRSLLLLLMLSAAARASQPFSLELRGGGSVLSGPEQFRLQYLGDNDSLGWAIAPNGLPFDRWYTNSAKLFGRWSLPAPRWLASEGRLLLSASLGQNMYTPRTAYVQDVSELQGDRPYSGWLNASAGADLITAKAPLALVREGNAYSQLGVELFAGAQGPWSGAGWVQHTAHHGYLLFEGRQLPPFLGWGKVETRPAFAVDASAFAETTLAVLQAHEVPDWLSWSAGRPSLYLLGGARGDLGQTLRAGAVNATLIGGWTGDPLGREKGLLPTALYAYARGEAKAVGYNATIDAPIIDGSVVARHAPVVYELSVGAVLRVWRAEVGYSQIFRSNETATLPAQLRGGQLIGQWSFTLVW